MTILDDLLTRPAMDAVHAAITGRYQWFEHVGWVDRFESYKSTGLETRNPELLGAEASSGATTGKAPPEPFPQLLRALGKPAEKIVCVRPIDSHNSTPTRPGPKFRMAFSGAHLPKILSLDWSCDGTLQLALNLAGAPNPWDPPAIFVEVAHRRGSIAVYENLPPSALRVWVKDTSTYNPATWPALTATAAADVEVIG